MTSLRSGNPGEHEARGAGDLGAELSAMTEWPEREPDLWRTALEQVGVPGAGSVRVGRFPRAVRGLAVLAAAACVLFAVVGLLNNGRELGVESEGRAVWSDRGEVSDRSALLEKDVRYGAPSEQALKLLSGVVDMGFAPPAPAEVNQQVAASKAPDAEEPVRMVARRAQVDLRTPDVRGAFAKVQFLASEAKGEYVEDSTIGGDGASAQASVILRVAAGRLGEVLSEIRGLGVVTSESVKAEDVTDQVVDLESRLRNEQRIEKELLELVEARKDAQLKDILEVRNELGRVRQEIERIVAQRDRLGRMVSLSTVLVVIRSDAVGITPVDPEQSLWSQFVNRLDRAWQDGVRGLSSSVAWLLQTLIAGVLWWALIVAAGVVVAWGRRRARRAAAKEPAPAA